MQLTKSSLLYSFERISATRLSTLRWKPYQAAIVALVLGVLRRTPKPRRLSFVFVLLILVHIANKLALIRLRPSH